MLVTLAAKVRGKSISRCRWRGRHQPAGWRARYERWGPSLSSPP